MHVVSIAAVISLLVAVPACQDTRAIDGARARLELARQRADLGEMYLALRDLQSLGLKDPALPNELAEVDSALKLDQQMKGERADHNHEAAVKSAAAIIDVFPNHTLARQTLKESGLIYRSLQAALTSTQDLADIERLEGSKVRGRRKYRGLISTNPHRDRARHL